MVVLNGSPVRLGPSRGPRQGRFTVRTAWLARESLAAVGQFPGMCPGLGELGDLGGSPDEQPRERGGLIEPRQPIRGDSGQIGDDGPFRRMTELLVMREPFKKSISADVQLGETFARLLRRRIDPDRLLEQPTRFCGIASAVPHGVRLHHERFAVLGLEALPARGAIFAFAPLLFRFLTPLSVHARRIASENGGEVNERNER